MLRRMWCPLDFGVSIVTYIDLEQREQPDSPFLLCWTGKARTFISSSVRVQSCIIYADWVGNIVALDEATGNKVWTIKASAAIIEPLFVFQELVWALDDRGHLIGYDVTDGRPRIEYRLRFRGWSLQHHDDHIYFMDRLGPQRFTKNSRPSRLNLITGEVVAFTDQVASDQAGNFNITRILAYENAVLFFLAPDLVKFSLVDRRVLQRWTIPYAYSLSGLLAFDRTVLGITELETSRGSRLGAARYRESNPTPLILLTDDQRYGYPLLVRGVYPYHTSAVRLHDQIFLIEAGETIFQWSNGTVGHMAALPQRSIYGTGSAGLFQVSDQMVVFQEQERVHTADEGYYVQVYACDAGQLELTSLGLPLRTHPHGRNYKGASVDQYDNNFFLRGDGRYHYLSWTGKDETVDVVRT